MAEHDYPAHFPKDSALPSVRAAWAIMDTVRPGIVHNITRFHLAGEIVTRLSQTDGVIEAAQELASFIETMEVVDLGEMSQLWPGLPEKIVELQIAVTRYRNGS